MRGAYNTRQKRELLSFLDGCGTQHFSVDELVFRLNENGRKIGRTTVYRALEQLAEQGSVRKYTGVQGVAQYQRVPDATRCDDHFHMMCCRCGNLMHVDCRLMRSMTEHLMTEHGFRLDAKQTILMGVCRDCREADGEAVEHGADCHDGCHDCV